MNNNSNDIIKSLAQTTYDSVEGYRKAAEKAESPQFKQALEQRAQERSQTLNKLNQTLQQKGEQPVNEASTMGKMHQAFLSVTDAFQDGNAAAAKRVEEGEDYLAGKFDEALEMDDEHLDAQSRSVIAECCQEVRSGERFGDIVQNTYA